MKTKITLALCATLLLTSCGEQPESELQTRINNWDKNEIFALSENYFSVKIGDNDLDENWECKIETEKTKYKSESYNCNCSWICKCPKWVFCKCASPWWSCRKINK